MSYKAEELKERRLIIKWIVLGILLLVAIIIAWMSFIPTYRVYKQTMRGKAAYEEAVQNRRIQVEEAQANFEAQVLNSKAEVERAKGMAEAIEIENGKLTTRYIQYLWVRNMESNEGEKYYIPTEANLPLLEARTTLKDLQ